jgi:hypothetical protein
MAGISAGWYSHIFEQKKQLRNTSISTFDAWNSTQNQNINRMVAHEKSFWGKKNWGSDLNRRKETTL